LLPALHEFRRQFKAIAGDAYDCAKFQARLFGNIGSASAFLQQSYLILLACARSRHFQRWKFKLFPSGSTVTGLASKGSDLDLTIWMPNALFFGQEPKHLCSASSRLQHPQNSAEGLFLKRSGLYQVLQVPVLRIRWKNGLEVDLCCCTDVYVSGIQNSYLIRGFSLWDSRFAPLCMFVKEWSFRNDVKNPKRGGFNSYAIVLLVAHFLQCGVSPPILPNLQKSGEYGGWATVSQPSVANFCWLEKNTMSLAELFILFLDYYSIFNFGTHYICMRDAAARRRLVNDVFSAFIRDPVDDHNPGRTVRDIEYLQNRFRWVAFECLAYILVLIMDNGCPARRGQIN
uniref:PAP-associated domain-containing protein n=1 Tax=Heligmosomoides polygyrus TaxID=6339 RepID=A0A8L8KCB9_HELPZ